MTATDVKYARDICSREYDKSPGCPEGGIARGTEKGNFSEV